MNSVHWQLDDPDGRFMLRPLGPQDADALCDAVRESLALLACWQDWATPDYAVDSARAYIDDCCRQWTAEWSNREFGIVDTAQARILGCVGINQVNPVNRFANLGYWVRSSCCGQGMATRASRLVAGFGFERMGLNRLELVVLPHNGASRRVAEKLGARFEGVLANRLMFRQRPQDAAMYSLTPVSFSGCDPRI